MNDSLKMAIVDIQETFPRVSKLVSAWQLDNIHHHGKQPEWEYRLLSKFSEAMKVIQETDVDNEESPLISAQLIQETDVENDE